MPDRFPYFMCNPAERLAETEFLDSDATAAYTILCYRAWRNERTATLPADEAQLCAMSRIPAARWPAVWLAVKPLLRLNRGVYEVPWMIQELEKLQKRSQLASNAVRARWANTSVKPTYEIRNARAFGSGSGSGSPAPKGEGLEGGNPQDNHKDRHDPVLSKQAQSVIDEMHKCLGVTVATTREERERVMAILNEGFAVADCIAVVGYWDKLCRVKAENRERFTSGYLFSMKVFPGLLALAKSGKGAVANRSATAGHSISRAERERIRQQITEAQNEIVGLTESGGYETQIAELEGQIRDWQRQLND